MRTRRLAFLAILMAFFMITPLVLSSSASQPNIKSGALALSNYNENLSVYLTSAEAFWSIHLSGGNISVSSVTVPSSVSGFSITLTHYALWKSSYEIFTKHGFGLLDGSEPYPNGALLTVNATSSSDAVTLANSLSQRFALAFVETSSSSTGSTFFSPIDFNTELNAYFYSLIPQAAGGFATMFSRSQLELNDLNYYQLSYSGSEYSVTAGGLSPLASSSFTLYKQLGLSGPSYNYSSEATSSTIDIHVLGGLINNSSEPFTNHFSNISSTIEIAKTSNNTIPNLSASLDFSFPTILAYRQVTPTLTPSSGSSVTVTITVSNISPVGGATADNVFVNDSWIYSQSTSFHLTQIQTSKEQTLGPGSSYTVIYAFTVTATSGTFEIPATPVTYQYSLSSDKTVAGESLLNPETIVVGGANMPQLEVVATLGGGSQIQSGQPQLANITIVNKGSGAAFGLASSGLSRQNLQPGSSWSYISNQSSSSLTQANATLSYRVNWQDAGGHSYNATSNAFSTVSDFANPGSPSLSLTKSVGALISNQVNVTLSVFNNSPTHFSGTINDTIPNGMSFVKSYNSSSIQSADGLVSGNFSSIPNQSTESFIYTLSVANTSENFVFLPASVSAVWNGQTITHNSGGYGLPLGVKATKIFTPAEGFQGSNVSISIGLVNKGTLPIYDVSLNNNYDPFISISNSSSSSAVVLPSGGHLDAVLVGNLTGSPGVYNSSSSAASFIFAGTNKTAASPVVEVSIFHLPEANLTYSAAKVEEGHDIVITVIITNPSNITISNISYTLTVPKGLEIVSKGAASFTVSSLGPDSNYTYSFTVITNQPYLYQLNSGKLTFQYQGHQLNGISSTLNLNINDDIPLRYGIPGIVGLLFVIGTIFYVRRLTRVPTTPTKQSTS